MTDTPLRKVSSELERDEPGGWDWALARRQCLRHASQLVPCRASAEDVAQEAVIRAWSKRAACRSADGPDAWLAAISRNEAHRLLSAERRSRALPLDEELFAARPERTHADVERRLAVRRVLGGLPTVQRTLIYLRYVEDLAYADIAERLGLPEGTVKVRLHRLHRRLQRDLRTIRE